MTTREEDAVRHLFVASTHDYILVITAKGKLHWVKVYRIPEVGSAGKGKAVVNLIQIDPDDRVAAMLATREFPEDRFVVLSTRNGYIKNVDFDPVTRVAGALAFHSVVDLQDRKVISTNSMATLFRGYEVILKGRDPREAWAMCQRICGV